MLVEIWGASIFSILTGCKTPAEDKPMANAGTFFGEYFLGFVSRT